MKFSANLGFLWTDRALPDAIRAAHGAGFDAVEFHWPYDFSATDVQRALDETGLPCLGLNTRRGNVAAGENGLSALPGRATEARDAIDEALDYAATVGAARVHVMSGNASGTDARETLLANLAYACDRAESLGLGLLIEPLNRYDAPDYFLKTTAQAIDILDDLNRDAAALMFDCYHVQLMEGDLTHRLQSLLPRIGHIQFASVPDRGAPDHGEVNYAHIFDHIRRLGYTSPLGAEYKPEGDTDATLDWLRTAR